MIRRMNLIRLTLVFCLCAAAPAMAQVQNDFDGDGLSDITYYTLSGSALVWQATGSQSGAEELNETFGASGDTPIMAHWLSTEAAAPAVVHIDTDGKTLVWKVLDDKRIESKSFGRAGDYVIAGCDFDGDGIADAAIMRVVKKRLRWTVKLNLFAAGDGTTQTKRFLFGSKNDRIFFARPEGDRCWPGIFGRGSKKKARAQFRDVLSRARLTFNVFPRRLARGVRPRPIAVRSGEGADMLAFVTNDGVDTTVSVYALDGMFVDNPTFSGLGQVIVGDYLADEGEEVVFQSGTGRKIYNPLSETIEEVTESGLNLLDEITIERVGTAPTPSPTASPTATATP